ncbi:GNAT family N-acetyltransferase [Psychromarinibacter halotolerans]|uniref:GNAT family N-acetyltransferase n=1 Tax=Psychromarinibacter halotolerans TaxID=1775175 RepID=A0ABV7GS07_9RHOB|nr:GNAT family N-acetyltransferase [Psychromarinibacter halotolerans]MDF0597679.1 GNAT family N-acetyltransferase [Psychromarinibacter halotolerans]
MTDTTTLQRPAVAPVSKQATAIKTLTAAFQTDPPVRWMYPDLADYRAHFPAFARAFGGVSIDADTAVLADGGAALWIAPGAEPDEAALAAAVERSIPVARPADVFAVFEAMGQVHPHDPHWYLPMIGVTPDRQGEGIGTALLRPVLARCDADGVPAYLEATTARSRDLYARHGFKQTARIEVAGCPPIYPMLRPPA